MGGPLNTPVLTPRPVRESASDYSEVALPNDANKHWAICSAGA